ncbi:endonuclease [Streptococcus iniae]|uniref:endonuclease n=1 Tax=Enterococcus italicus TaxID=246144 RepID=UPI002074418E|nr:endonuclease [Enterococcus italicus]MCM6930981.1 endonuclease [Enterococcus italicus]WHL24301.1 endonuclease [Streptococcus iniae]
MSKLTINSITIVDYENQLANKFEFGPDSNLITSEDNGVGKSSLLKSIYYSLGASIKSFPKGWDYKKYIFQLDCGVDGNNVVIQRFNKVFTVRENDTVKSFANEKTFSAWFQGMMGMALELQTSNSEKRSLAYMNAVLTPFYIDQDRSWTSFYKDAIEGVGMYVGQPKTIFEYYFGLSSEQLLRLEEQKKLATIYKNEVESQIRQVSNVYDSYSTDKNTDGISPEEFEELQTELMAYIQITNELRGKISKISSSITTSKTKLDGYRHDLDELNKLLSMTGKRFRDIEYECTYCHSILTREQSLTRLELADNDFEIRQRKSEIEQLISDEEKKLSKSIEEIESFRTDFEEKNNRISRLKNATKIEDYVSQKVLSELQQLISKYELERAENEKQSKELAKQIRSEKKRLKEKQEDLEKSFEVLKNNLSIKIGDTSLVDRKFLDFKKVQETGTALNKSLLSLYLIYSNLLSQESKILFPIAIDSFIKNEISDKNEKKMFLAVQDDFVSLDNQTFFSVIKKNMDHFAERRSRVTLLTKPLLKQEMFEELQSELIKEGE